jgi:hypothetical protein
MSLVPREPADNFIVDGNDIGRIRCAIVQNQFAIVVHGHAQERRVDF